jgi:ADP-ribose pyrophosphatase
MSKSHSTPDTAKPEGEKAGWRVLESRYLHQDSLTKLRQDRIELAGQDELTYTYCERAECVIIVPVTPAGKMVMIQQYRYPVDAWCLEVPAGGTHDTGDAALEDVVRKELQEEVGATCERLEYVTFFYGSNSLSDEKCHVFLAMDVVLAQEPDAEQSEDIKLQLVPFAEALNLARTGQMKTGPCALAVLLCEPALRRNGYVVSGASALQEGSQ